MTCYRIVRNNTPAFNGKGTKRQLDWLRIWCPGRLLILSNMGLISTTVEYMSEMSESHAVFDPGMSKLHHSLQQSHGEETRLKQSSPQGGLLYQDCYLSGMNYCLRPKECETNKSRPYFNSKTESSSKILCVTHKISHT